MRRARSMWWPTTWGTARSGASPACSGLVGSSVVTIGSLDSSSSSDIGGGGGDDLGVDPRQGGHEAGVAVAVGAVPAARGAHPRRQVDHRVARRRGPAVVAGAEV